MIVTSTLRPGEKLTDEERKMIEKAKQMPIVFDEDCPEITPEMIKNNLRIARIKDGN